MPSRKIPLIEGEFYHIYNRGVDKRDVFQDKEDIDRFIQSIIEFNVIDPIRSLFENSLHKKKTILRNSIPQDKLVEIMAYCLNPNHYHFILKQVSEKGIEKFMHKVGTGFTNYFNAKNERTGALFQGKFKSIHINKDQYLTNLSAYVNLNFRVHKIKGLALKLTKSSWGEYMGENHENICEKKVVLNYFKDKEQYKKFAFNSVKETLLRRESEKILRDILLE